MFNKIGHRLKSLKKLGTRLAHGASIGLRKTSKVLGRASKMAPEISGKMAGVCTSRGGRRCTDDRKRGRVERRGTCGKGKHGQPHCLTGFRQCKQGRF